VSEDLGRRDSVECSEVVKCGEDEIDNASSLSFGSFTSEMSFSEEFHALVCPSSISRSAPRLNLASEVDIVGGELDFNESARYRDLGKVKLNKLNKCDVYIIVFIADLASSAFPRVQRSVFRCSCALRKASDADSRCIETFAHTLSKAYTMVPESILFDECDLKKQGREKER